jgi:sterol 24-C-methyltransferase
MKPSANIYSSVQRYFNSIESRLGYWLVLGGTRHFGYYHANTYWPFPIHKALRAMEDQLLVSLRLDPGASVLDAGCGVGHVAIYLAQKGLRVQCIDIVDHHIDKAQRNIKAQGLQDVVSVRKMDYHHLEGFIDESFDGVYTMETLVHATEPAVALHEFFRVLKPGGSISLNEYEYKNPDTVPTEVRDTRQLINKYASMPAAESFREGSIQELLEESGFLDVVVEDFSANIMPMLRLFYILSYIPYLFIKLLGLRGRFVNTTAGFEGYRGKQYWRYVAISARKPGKKSVIRRAAGVEKA